METLLLEPTQKAFVPWNKGKVTGQKPPLKPREVWAMRVRLQISNRVRDLALFNLAIDSKLRGCDLVHLRVEDIMQADQVRTRALISQRKTGAPVQFEITEQARVAVANWVRGRALKPMDWLFPSRVDKDKPMTTRQYGRLVDEWIAAIGLSPAAYGTHSLRRTKAALIYRKTGNIRAVQIAARPYEA
jgi:integrase